MNMNTDELSPGIVGITEEFDNAEIWSTVLKAMMVVDTLQTSKTFEDGTPVMKTFHNSGSSHKTVLRTAEVYQFCAAVGLGTGRCCMYFKDQVTGDWHEVEDKYEAEDLYASIISSPLSNLDLAKGDGLEQLRQSESFDGPCALLELESRRDAAFKAASKSR